MSVGNEVIHTITIQGQTFQVHKFKGLKAILAAAALTRVARTVPGITNRVADEFRKNNYTTITREMAKLPRWGGWDEKDWDENNEIKVPAQMDQNEAIMAALPELLEGARTEMTRLMAITLTPNAELMVADKEGKVEALLDKHHELLLYEADLDELVEVALITYETVGVQLEDKGSRLGKMWRGLRSMVSGQFTQQTPTPLPSGQETAETESTSKTSKPESPTSSTPSPEPMAGSESTPSTESPGASSPASVA